MLLEYSVAWIVETSSSYETYVGQTLRAWRSMLYLRLISCRRYFGSGPYTALMSGLRANVRPHLYSKCMNQASSHVRTVRRSTIFAKSPLQTNLTYASKCCIDGNPVLRFT
ncbi:hypothetical protein ACHAXT_005792 [Thalassiosira profunda]